MSLARNLSKRTCYNTTARSRPVDSMEKDFYQQDRLDDEMNYENYENENSANSMDGFDSSMSKPTPQASTSGFVSARNQYIIDKQKKFGKSYNPENDR